MAEGSFPFKTPSMNWGLASTKLDVSQISAVDRKLFIQAFWKAVRSTWRATLRSKAKPTQVVATAQHRATSAIRSAEE